MRRMFRALSSAASFAPASPFSMSSQYHLLEDKALLLMVVRKRDYIATAHPEALRKLEAMEILATRAA